MIRSKMHGINILTLFGFILVAFLFAAASAAAESTEMGGWEPGSPYNKLYQASERDSFKGHIVKMEEVIPMKGMSPGVVLQVRGADGEVIVVHVCPVWYMNAKSTGLKKGDRVKVKGCWAEVNGEDVFMAAKISIEDYFVLKVRLTKDGKPFWGMSAEELAREKTEVGSK